MHGTKVSIHNYHVLKLYLLHISINFKPYKLHKLAFDVLTVDLQNTVYEWFGTMLRRKVPLVEICYPNSFEACWCLWSNKRWCWTYVSTPFRATECSYGEPFFPWVYNCSMLNALVYPICHYLLNHIHLAKANIKTFINT